MRYNSSDLSPMLVDFTSNSARDLEGSRSRRDLPRDSSTLEEIPRRADLFRILGTNMDVSEADHRVTPKEEQHWRSSMTVLDRRLMMIRILGLEPSKTTSGRRSESGRASILSTSNRAVLALCDR